MTNREISYHIRGAAMAVYNELGPGLLESIYHKALKFELESRGLKVDSELVVDVIYKGHLIDNSLRLDMIVEDQVIVELKSVEDLMSIHYKQLKTYLRLCKREIGWLINFGAYNFNEGMRSIKINLSDD
jgi:GxxExxY protein